MPNTSQDLPAQAPSIETQVDVLALAGGFYPTLPVGVKDHDQFWAEAILAKSRT